MTKTLLSLPPSLVSSFSKICNKSQRNFFVDSDPRGTHLGSGGGTAWILAQQWKKAQTSNDSQTPINPDILENSKSKNFLDFCHNQKKILIHAGGQSRRLPSYAASGKIMTPIPVFRWKSGQSIDQTLLDIQLDFYNHVSSITNPNQNLIIASGDVLLRCSSFPPSLPTADIVVLTTWIDASVATHHGVLFAERKTPSVPDFMLQKPTAKKIESLLDSHLFMMDTGCWILSDKAVDVLMKKCGWTGEQFSGEKNPCASNTKSCDDLTCNSLDFDSLPLPYDFYTSFGESLGTNPTVFDDDISSLSCAIVNLSDGEFYHYGTSREIISSTEKIQNLVTDPRNIYQRKVKVHSSLFTQNSHIELQWKDFMRNIWIENSFIPSSWQLFSDSVVTGVPQNSWDLLIPQGICLDIVPISDNEYCLRPYGLDDAFRGEIALESTKWLGESIGSWFAKRNLSIATVVADKKCDMQTAKIFPVLNADQMPDVAGKLLSWMLGSFDFTDVKQATDISNFYLSCKKLSADDLLDKADVVKLNKQREVFKKENLSSMAKNYSRSVFYQCDLHRTSNLYHEYKMPSPAEISSDVDFITCMRDKMFRSELNRLNGISGDKYEKEAFVALQEAIISTVEKVTPVYDIIPDQIVWGRSPARVDLAGGWSDTPPFSLYNGGAVVNVAINMNGQQPIQTYIRPIKENAFILRSIDTGMSETVTTFEQLESYAKVGSSFSIPKAALCLSGFSPAFCCESFPTLKSQLESLGGGLEITLLAAIPKGSGLGTSSILAATLLGTLSDICSLRWSLQEIAYRTLALEQLLTSGGGWQDQYGGIFGGIKICESTSGLQNSILVKKLPTDVILDRSSSGLWLLYYTGITRIAKNILGDIVRSMFLNRSSVISVAEEIKQHAYDMSDALHFNDYEKTAHYIKRSWQLNKALDKGVSTPQIDAMLSRIDDYVHGYKLTGAGGGGYLLICAKDTDCVSRIQHELKTNPLNDRARFVDMSLNQDGLIITRS